MANEEHLAILRQGVEVWNAWREEHPDVRPDLEQVDLRRADLRRADLRRADLRRVILHDAILHDAILYEADLTGAYLREASLTGTDLTGTDLTGTDLTEAILTEAILREAILTGAILTGAILTGADLTYVQVGATSFDDLDLRNVHGLETVVHIAPSTIGIDTLYRSQGQIPEVFLRGCGVPDSMIEYARSLVTAERPIDYYSVFISYSSHDEAIAQRLHADLQARGVRCWFAPHDLEIGEVITRGIDEAIRIYDKLLIILSEAAVQSRWVEFEVNQALHREVEQGRTMRCSFRSGLMIPYCTRRAAGPCSSAPGTSATFEGGRITTVIRRRSRGCSGI